MAGPQFAHIQTWSRKPNKAGQSIDQIIGEATRDPEFSVHVETPLPPRILVGDPSTFSAEHDAHVAARATVVRMKDGTERRRAIRGDRHTMASVIMSYPVPRAAIVTDEAKERLAAWERRNLEWLSATYGDQVRVVLAHDDEVQPHLHAWLLPDDPGADATTLHPGKVAKKHIEAEAKASGVGPREAVKAGNKALKEAMTGWQDAYHAAVGAPEGLTRTGPKRRRLNRQQWKAEKAAAAATADVQKRAGMAKAEAADLLAEAEAKAAAIVREAEAEAERLRNDATADARARAAAFEALEREIKAGTIRRLPDGNPTAKDPAAMLPGRPHIDAAIKATLSAQDAAATYLANAEAVLKEAEKSAQEQKQAAFLVRADAEEAKAAAKEILAEAETARAEAFGLLQTLRMMVGRVREWLARPDLPAAVYVDGQKLVRVSRAVLSPPKPTEETGNGPSGP